tara:strand:- start:243 stop:875 length:633 start_codon:yes stop_codon:yes gene_type:complete
MNFTSPKRDEKLWQIAERLGSDKSTPNRTNNLCYLSIYENYFKKFKYDNINILEIGVRNGPSVRTWKQYFPLATIFGVDIDERCKQHEEERVHITIGDATEKTTIDKINPSHINYDIIIDDGSHVNEDIIKTYNLLWDKLSSGGIYIIEDLYNSYGSTDGDILIDSTGIPQNKREQINPFFNSIIKNVDTPNNKTLSVHFWDSICIIIKV